MIPVIGILVIFALGYYGRKFKPYARRLIKWLRLGAAKG
jgi:hypothetical protein